MIYLMKFLRWEIRVLQRQQRRTLPETNAGDENGGEVTTTETEMARAQDPEEGGCYGGAEKEISTHHPPQCTLLLFTY